MPLSEDILKLMDEYDLYELTDLAVIAELQDSISKYEPIFVESHQSKK